MTLSYAFREVVKKHIAEHGCGTIVTRQQLSQMVMEAYPHNHNSFLPADYCYNRTNKGISFETHVHLFEFLDDGRYRILGEDYPYSGAVYCREMGETEDRVYGSWYHGVFSPAGAAAPELMFRAKRLAEELRHLKLVTQQSETDEKPVVTVTSTGEPLCKIAVWEEAYQISTTLPNWKETTTYQGNTTQEGVFTYVADRMDETVAEVQRMTACQRNVQPARFEELVRSLSLDQLETWRQDVRPLLQKLFAPLVEGTEFYLSVNTTDTRSKILELHKIGVPKRLVGFSGKQNMEIIAFFNADFYNQIRMRVPLPDNQRPNKTQPHVIISLQTLWNVICAATDNNQCMA